MLLQKVTKNSPRGKPLGDPHFQANARAAGHKDRQPFGSCGTIEDPSLATSAAAPRTPIQTNLTACAAQSDCSPWFGVALWLSSSGLRFTAAQLRRTSSAALAESTGDLLGEGRQAHRRKIVLSGRSRYQKLYLLLTLRMSHNLSWKSETKEVSAIFWVLFNRLKSTSPWGRNPLISPPWSAKSPKPPLPRTKYPLDIVNQPQ